MISKLQTKNIAYSALILVAAFLINSCSDLGNPVDPPEPEPDNAPVLDSIGAQYALAGNTFEIVITASDDYSAVTLTASIVPNGASFIDSGNGVGVFSWIPTLPNLDTVITINVTFVATDTAMQSDSETITITITGRSFNNYINPLFQTTGCSATNCHGTSPQSGFSVASYTSVLAGGINGAGIVPGRPDLSIVYLKLTANPPFGLRMPRFSTPFSDQRLDSIRLWILAGAPQN